MFQVGVSIQYHVSRKLRRILKKLRKNIKGPKGNKIHSLLVLLKWIQYTIFSQNVLSKVKSVSKSGNNLPIFSYKVDLLYGFEFLADNLIGY